MTHYLTPEEINHLVQRMLDAVDRQAIPAEAAIELEHVLGNFTGCWQVNFARFGRQLAGELAYRDALLYFQEVAAPMVRPWLPADGPGQSALTTLETMLSSSPLPSRRFNRQLLAQMRQQRQAGQVQLAHVPVPQCDRPLFIVSAPRAGSTLLFETLAQLPEVWTIGQESHDIELDIPALHPAAYAYASNRLTAAATSPTVADAVRHWFGRRVQDRAGCLYAMLPAEQRPQSVRFLEKTPKNALRIPFLKALFPDARFIFLYREPRQNISSLLEGWRSRRFVAYREMPGWPYKEWSFLLIPGWETLADRPLVEIAARQWCVANTQIQADLQALPPDDWFFVTYQAFVEQPAETIRQICRFAGLQGDAAVEQAITGGLPLSQMVISPPVPDKWRRHAAEIEPILPTVQPVVEQMETLVNAW
jgi:hypothetical protein